MYATSCDPDQWLNATRSGSIKKAESCLSAGHPIDGVHPASKTTGLMEACRNGHPKMAEWLLDRKAQPSLQSLPHKFTALHLSIMSGHTRCAELLLAYGTNVSLQDSLGRTALHHAIISDTIDETHRLKLLDHLLIYTAPIDIADIEGATALHYCAIYNRPEAARLLLKHGADANRATNDCSLTACHIAAIEGLQDLVQLLLQNGANLDLPTAQGWSVRSRYPNLCDAPLGKQTSVTHNAS